jgi:hypothetical protein
VFINSSIVEGGNSHGNSAKKKSELADSLLHRYMVGREPGVARPTLIFTCKRPKPRRRAMKFVKESDILHGHPKVALAESSTMPMAMGMGYATLLAGPSDSYPAPASRTWIPKKDVSTTTSATGATSLIPAHGKISTPYKTKAIGAAAPNTKTVPSPSRSRSVELPWNEFGTWKYEGQHSLRHRPPVTIYSLGDVVSFLTRPLLPTPPQESVQALVSEVYVDSKNHSTPDTLGDEKGDDVGFEGQEASGPGQLSKSPLSQTNHFTTNKAPLLSSAVGLPFLENQHPELKGMMNRAQGSTEGLKSHSIDHSAMSLSSRSLGIPLSNEALQMKNIGMTGAHTIDCTTLYGMFIFGGRYATIGTSKTPLVSPSF